MRQPASCHAEPSGRPGCGSDPSAAARRLRWAGLELAHVVWAAPARRRWRRRNPVREFFVVLIVLSTLTGLLAKRLLDRGLDARRAAGEHNVAMINQAIERWRFEKGQWPAADLHDIAQDRSYFPNGLPSCPVTGEPYRMDARTHRVPRPRADVAARDREQ